MADAAHRDYLGWQAQPAPARPLTTPSAGRAAPTSHGCAARILALICTAMLLTACSGDPGTGPVGQVGPRHLHALQHGAQRPSALGPGALHRRPTAHAAR